MISVVTEFLSRTLGRYSELHQSGYIPSTVTGCIIDITIISRLAVGCICGGSWDSIIPTGSQFIGQQFTNTISFICMPQSFLWLVSLRIPHYIPFAFMKAYALCLMLGQKIGMINRYLFVSRAAVAGPVSPIDSTVPSAA